MMANPVRGEIAAQIDGRQWTLCLTLGALAALESDLGADNLADLANRFAKGTLSASDLVKVIAAGLRGGGHHVNDDDVAAMKIDGGVAGFVALAAKLLEATFTPVGDV